MRTLYYENSNLEDHDTNLGLQERCFVLTWDGLLIKEEERIQRRTEELSHTVTLRIRYDGSCLSHYEGPDPLTASQSHMSHATPLTCHLPSLTVSSLIFFLVSTLLSLTSLFTSFLSCSLLSSHTRRTRSKWKQTMATQKQMMVMRAAGWRHNRRS